MNWISQNFIGGRSVNPLGTERIEVRSPCSGELIGSVPAATKADVELAVDTARKAFDTGAWPRLSPAERQAILKRFAELHVRQEEDFAQLVTRENGSPLYGGVWSKDKMAAVEVAKRIRTGSVSIGGAFPNFFSPFGGFKQSGFGREFGTEGLNHYVENQSIAL